MNSLDNFLVHNHCLVISGARSDGCWRWTVTSPVPRRPGWVRRVGVSFALFDAFWTFFRQKKSEGLGIATTQTFASCRFEVGSDTES